MSASIVLLSLMLFLNTLDEQILTEFNAKASQHYAGLKPKEVECAKVTYPPDPSRNVPEFVINLDLPPEERFKELSSKYSTKLGVLLSAIKNLTNPIFHGTLFELIDKYMPRLVSTLPYPFAGEMQGIADGSGISLGEVALYNVFYEVFTVCTSILAQTPSGNLYHGRNLDFGLLLGWDSKNNTWLVTEILRGMVVQLDFQRGGVTVFKSTTLVGYVGVITGMKPNNFSLTVDERFKAAGGYIGIIEWIMGKRSGHWMSFLTRNIMENTTSYAQAQKSLATSELLAPVYFILGGNKQGQASVITRGLTSYDIWDIGSNMSWYLVETNYDHWKEPPSFDNRRAPAQQCMNEMGQQNLTLGGMFNVFSTRPVLNKETVYTTLMEVAGGTIQSYLQFCDDPCPKFFGNEILR